MITTVPLTGKLTAPGSGGIAVRGTVAAFPNTTNYALSFSADNENTLGPVVADVAADGTFTLQIPVNSDQQAELLWTLVVKTSERVPGLNQTVTWTPGTFIITAAVDLADLEAVAITSVSETQLANFSVMIDDAQAAATAASTSATQAETAAAEAVAVGNTNDTIIAGRVNDPASATSGALSATITKAGHTVPAWAPTTAYTIGQQVLNPSGQVVAAKVAFTSGATYNAANWNPSTTLAVRAKDVQGGQHLAPVRVPQLSVVESWPNPVAPFLRLMWTESNGATIYAYDRGRSIWKSTDSGRTYTRTGSSKVGATSIQFGTVFWKTTAGSLLAFRSDYDQMYRSTDDGATWTSVHTLPFKQLLGAQSICQDLVTGYLYYAEYPTLTGLTSPTCNLWRSTDDGVTWSVFYTFNTSGAGAIDHIHSIQWDHVAQRVVISAGDSNPDAGLYRINAAGTGVEVIAVNSQFSAADLGIARTIGIMPMTNYLVWATDTGALPYVCRMHRSQIGQPNPVIEKVYRINSAGWWTVKASDDGTRWVFSATGENPTNRIDSVSHLYAVEDEGATVYEIGTIRARKEDTVSIAPVGAPGNHGDVFFMQSHTDAEPGSWKFALGRGSGIAIPWPQRIQVPFTKTFNTGPVSIAAGAEVVFHTETAPYRSSVLHLFDAGASASVRCVLRVNGVDVLNTGSRSERVTRDADWGAAFLTHTAAGGQTVEVILKNQGGATVTDAKAHITYGWGSGVGIV